MLSIPAENKQNFIKECWLLFGRPNGQGEFFFKTTALKSAHIQVDDLRFIMFVETKPGETIAVKKGYFTSENHIEFVNRVAKKNGIHKNQNQRY